MEGARFDAIKPLLEAQPYISSVRWSNDKAGVTHDFSGFRKIERIPNENLAEWQWRHIGLEGKVDLEPWLTVSPYTCTAEHCVFARSLRYHNPAFPWVALLEKFGELAWFVGLKEEHLAFERAFGSIFYVPSTELRTLALIIDGSGLFIGNQSVAFWISAGLGVPIVQETRLNGSQDSIVPRDNIIYSRTPYETSTIMERTASLLSRLCA